MLICGRLLSKGHRLFIPRRPFLFKVLVCLLVLGASQSGFAAYDAAVTYNGTAVQLASGVGVFTSPNGLALDLSGNLYIADTGNNRILKVPAGGTTAQLFAITISSPSTFSAPNQLAVDSAGNLYIADTGNSRIVESDPSGNGSVLSTGSLSLSQPQGVAVDASGDVFIADSANNRIVEIPSGGTAKVLVTTGIALTTLTTPEGLATDTYGNLYIVDFVAGGSASNRVLKVNTSQVASTVSTGYALSSPVSVTVASNGIIYITDAARQRIAVNDPQGDLYDLFFDQINSEFGTPGAIATDSQGAFYITDTQNNVVNLFHQGSAAFGHVQLGSSGTPETLNFNINGITTLTGVAIYTAGTQNLDFTIAANSGTPCTTGSNGINCTVNVQFTPTVAGLRRGALVLSYINSVSGAGSFTVPLFGIGDAPVAALVPGIASSLSYGSVTFSEPFQTAYDGVGNVYATDSANNRVLKIAAAGGAATVVTIPALSPSPATLNGPTGLAIDGAGNLFIADSGNNRIVEVTAAGTSQVVSACMVETVTPCTSYSFNNPQSLFIDGSGNLIVDDAGNHNIVELTVAYSESMDNTLDLTNAYVLATGSFAVGANSNAVVDTAEGLYFPDETNNRIIKVDRFGSASTVDFSSLSTALTTPHSVALDPMGNLYVMDAGGPSGNQRIVQELTNGTVSTLPFSGATLGSSPNQMAVDSGGNVLVADANNRRLLQINVGESALSFPNTQQYATSAPQTATVANLGNQSLVFSSTSYTAYFPRNTTDLNLCATGTTLLAGQSCDVSVEFSPQSIGPYFQYVTVTDNTQNVTPTIQYISVSGTGTNPPDSTATTVSISPSSPMIGQAATITVSVSDTTSGHGSYVPTGNVILSDTLGGTTTLLNGGSAVALNAGTATLSVTFQQPGTHTITANYAGVSGSYLTSSNSITAQVRTDFTIAASRGTTAVASPGGTTTFPLTVSPANGAQGLTEAVTFTVAGLPSGATWTITPNPVPAGASANTPVSLTILWSQQSAALNHTNRLAQKLSPLMVGIFILPWGSRMRRWIGKRAVLKCLLLAVLAGSVLSLAGCGSSNSGYFGQSQKTYTVTLTGSTASGLSHSVNFTVAVQ